MKKIILLVFFLITNLIYSQEILLDAINESTDSTNTNVLPNMTAIKSNDVVKTYNPLLPPNTYTNHDNPNYWKNKIPVDGYWQQDVHYKINAELIDTQNVIKGHEILHYTNNSPDELTHVFFHLYQNAFQPDSYYDLFQKSKNLSSHLINQEPLWFFFL